MIKLFLVATLAITSYAGVVYEFKGSSTLFTDETATLTLPGFITSAAEYLPGVNVVCSICSHFRVYPREVLSDMAVAVGYGVGLTTFFFYFPPDAFTTPGLYSSIFLQNQVGTLRVTSREIIPEPSTALMLAGGLGLAAFLLRRR